MFLELSKTKKRRCLGRLLKNVIIWLQSHPGHPGDGNTQAPISRGSPSATSLLVIKQREKRLVFTTRKLNKIAK